MGALYSMLSRLRTIDFESGAQGAAENAARRDNALKDQLAALARERANEAGSGSGFFDSVAHLVSDVASDLVHGNLGQALSDAGTDISAAWNSPRFWADLESGIAHLSIVTDGVVEVAHCVGGKAGAAVASVATDVTEAVSVVGVLAQARSKLFDAAVIDARADETQAKDQLDAIQRATSWVVDAAKQNDASHARTLESVRGAILTSDSSLAAASANGERGAEWT
jgi:hypothetical protein